MDQRTVVVETNLDDEVEWRGQNYTRHARTRFVERQRSEPPRTPEAGDPWCSLTVRARLHRVGWVLRQDPKVQPQQVRSCMPDHVRELFKDLPAEPMRLAIPAVHQDAVNDTLTDLLRYRFDDESKAVIFALVTKLSGDELGRTIRRSDTHARTLMKRMLDRLALEWNAQPWRPDAYDIERARQLIHRNVK